MIDTLLRDAWRAYQAGGLADAARLYEEILSVNPRQFDALYLFGFLNLQRGHYSDAERLFSVAAGINPTMLEIQLARGNALLNLERREESLACFDAVLAREPHKFEANYNRGAALLGLGRFTESLASTDKALAIEPGNARAHINRAFALLELKRHAEAFTSFDKALAIEPRNFAAWANRGVVQLEKRRYADSLKSFDAAIEIVPDSAGVWGNRGQALTGLLRYDEALASFDRALALSPNDTETLIHRAWVLIELERFEEACADYQKVVEIDPDFPEAKGFLLQSKLRICDWASLAEMREDIAHAIRQGRRVIPPFVNFRISGSPADQLHCSRMQAVSIAVAPTPLPNGGRYGHDRIRVAYVAGTFHTHPTAYLLAGVIENHDRSRFETVGISFGPNDNSPIRYRIRAGFEHFHELNLSDDETATFLRQMEIDVAVDLMGFTGNHRAGIFANRGAPVQVSYLGFPGTMGADFIDYLIADRTVIPDKDQRYYSEKVIYLPDTYQATDAKRPIASRIPTRAEVGLPAEGFVFCCLNSPYKIMPEMFDVWMRLLQAVPDAVLWLLDPGPSAIRNLSREAARRGIAPHRLVFAPPALQEDYLTRLRLADLCLDTLPYNAHATASDALWAGVPLLTQIGTSFAGRVAASVLRAMGLPELVTESVEDYEALAIELARDRQALAALKGKLAYNRRVHPLFDTERFTRNLEVAYTIMCDRHAKGQAPASFAVG